MFVIHRSVDLDFAHHVRGHLGACINLHGHTWKFEVGCGAEFLDPQGFVVDFGDLSERVLKPCEALLDHSLAIGEDTYADVEALLKPIGEKLRESRKVVHGHMGEEYFPELCLGGAELKYPGGLKVAVFPFTPTSERLAQWLYDLAHRQLANDRVSIVYTRIYETLHPVESVAEYRP